MTLPENLSAGPPIPVTALQLRQQSYLLQTGANRAEAAEVTDKAFSVRDFFKIALKHKWLLLATTAFCTTVAVLQGLTTVPVYQASVLLQIDQSSARIVQFNRDVDATQGDESLTLQTQYELLQSRSLAERVIDELQLDSTRAPSRLPADAATGKPIVIGAAPRDITIEAGGNLWTSIVSGYRRLGKPSVDDRVYLSRESVVAGFMGSIKVEPVRNSRLVKVKVFNTNAAQAARIANAIANTFVTLGLERRSQSSTYAKSFLEEQLRVTKARLEESERTLNAYAKVNSILSLDEKTNVINQTYTDYSSALGKVEQDRLKSEAIYNAVAISPESAPQILDSKTVQLYKEQKAKLEAEYLTNLSIYKPEFPKMLQLKAQISELEGRIKGEVAAVLTSLKAQVDAVKKQEDKVRERLQDTRKEILLSQDKNVSLNLYKRELSTNRELYDGLLQRLKEVGVSSGVVANNISVVDEANMPLFPISPNLQKNAGMGLLVGMLLGMGIVFLREQLDESVKNANEIEAKLGLPLLGIVPVVKKKQVSANSLALLTVKDPRGTFAESYRSMRTALQFSTAEGAPRRLMVTSSVQTEGKSTTALALAVNLAQLGQRVLLIDADMRNPTQHKALERPNQSGLSSYLSGDAQREALIQDSGIANLSVLTAGPHPPSPVDLLMGPGLLELLDRAEALGFEKIIIDAPPVLGIADAIVLGNHMQNILFAVKAGSTKLSSIRDALRRLRLAGLMPLGVVLTSAGGSESHYYGYYGAYGEQNASAGTGNRLTSTTLAEAASVKAA